MSGNIKIYVVSIGGAGSSILNCFIDTNRHDVTTVAIDVDANISGWASKANKKPFYGEITKGLGAFAKPEVGEEAIQMHEKDFKDLISDADFVIVVSVMGGGTGTGGAPLIAKYSKEIGACVVGITAPPLPFEARIRQANALTGLEKFELNCDLCFAFSTEKIFNSLGKELSMPYFLKSIDGIFRDSINCIMESISADKSELSYAKIRKQIETKIGDFLPD